METSNRVVIDLRDLNFMEGEVDVENKYSYWDSHNGVRFENRRVKTRPWTLKFKKNRQPILDVDCQSLECYQITQSQNKSTHL